VKHNWLWTTIGEGEHPYDFDSFRVFIWSLHRHRYETAYIQRKVQGFFPVLTQPPGFSVCLESDNGERVRRTYAFIVNIVRFNSQQACEPANSILPGPGVATPDLPNQAPGPAAAERSLYVRLKAFARKWFSR